MVDEIKKFFNDIRLLEKPVLTDISSGTAFNGQELLDLVDKTAAFLEELKAFYEADFRLLGYDRD